MPKFPMRAIRSAFIRIYLSNPTENGDVDYTYGEILDAVKAFAFEYNARYCVILHDRDFHYMSREKVPAHALIVLRMHSPVCEKEIKKYFPYCSIRSARSLFACTQYLLHKNDPDKAQYNACEIETNYSGKELDDILSYDLIL